MKTIWAEGLKGAELFRFMKANKGDILAFKKAQRKNADEVCLVPGIPALPAHLMQHKSYLYSNDEVKGELQRTIVMNTYNWLDSHDDVHQTNLFAQSINDRGLKIPHLHDHEFKIAAKVGIPISWAEKTMSWKELGVQRDGDTQALILESKIKKTLNDGVYKGYLDNEIDQHSVSMSYVKIEMAINDKDYEEEYKAWQTTFPKLGNPDKAIAQGYYFPVYEAKLYEGSAVLLGSNEITPTLNNSKFESPKGARAESPVALNVEELVKCYM